MPLHIGDGLGRVLGKIYLKKRVRPLFLIEKSVRPPVDGPGRLPHKF